MLIARTNSGENAGHTVYHDGIKYVFHLAPSAIFSGKPNVIGPSCVMDPISFMESEISQLLNNGISYDNLFVGNTSIVTPYHKVIDALGKANSSTLKGISPVHSSKVRKKDIRLDDLFGSKDFQSKKFEEDMDIFEALINYFGTSRWDLSQKLQEFNSDGNIRIPKHVIDFLEDKDPIDYLIDLYEKNVVNNDNFPKITDTQKMIQDTLTKGGKVILEGPQSFYLSNMVQTHHSSSTSADTTSAGIASAAGINLGKYRLVTINVHKAPASSRVGLGANPAGYVSQDWFSNKGINTLEHESLEGLCENFDDVQKAFFESIQENGIIKPAIYIDKDKEIDTKVAMAISSSKKYGERGATTLKPRITGMFDCVAHHKVNTEQGPYLTISALDRGDICDKIGLVIAYAVSNEDDLPLISNGITYNHGDIIRPGDSLPNENVLYHCVPIVKIIDGWKNTPIGAGLMAKTDMLPTNVARFVSEVEHYTKAIVISVGNGPNTEDLIYIKNS
jgi:adenylosuccinate synthase